MSYHKLWCRELSCWKIPLTRHSDFFSAFLPSACDQSKVFPTPYIYFCLMLTHALFSLITKEVAPDVAVLQLIMRHVDSFFPFFFWFWGSSHLAAIFFVFYNLFLGASFPILTSTFGGVELDAIHFVKDAAPEATDTPSWDCGTCSACCLLPLPGCCYLCYFYKYIKQKEHAPYLPLGNT